MSRPATKGTSRSKGSVWGKVLALVLAVIFVAAAVMRFQQIRQRLGAARIVTAVEAVTVQAGAGGQRPPERLLRANLAILDQAAKLDPTSVRVPLASGACYFLLGRFPAACRTYEAAAEIETRAEVYANLGRCRLAMGDRQAAMKAIRKAIRLDRNQRRVFARELEKDARLRELRQRESNPGEKVGSDGGEPAADEDAITGDGEESTP